MMYTSYMHCKSDTLFRYAESALVRLFQEGYSGLLLGPRQTGKTTLIQSCLKGKTNILEYPLQNPGIRLDLEAKPERLIEQARAAPSQPLLFIDEAQKIPILFDALQVLLDGKEAQAILTGSSARKLRRGGANLLPGRLKRFYLDPLLWGELGWLSKIKSSIRELRVENVNPPQSYSLDQSLVFGSLPGIVRLPEKDRGDFLKSYAETYLEEEIRAEALVRKIGSFSRFLELAAVESGNNPNFTKLSNESGVSAHAIREFYQILEDTLIVERVDPFLKNARKRILSSSRYYFFDTGVRNVLARLPLEPRILSVQRGPLFEQAVILEISRRIRTLNLNYKVHYWRTSGGAEVDCVLDTGEKIIPIEIKSCSRVDKSDVKGLHIFLQDYASLATKGYVIFTGQRPEKITPNITAIPWNEL